MTNETKWTLEPWSGLPSRDIVDENGERVARVPCEDCEIIGGDIGKSGRMILAAPAMYEALKAFMRAPSIGSDGPGSLTIVVQEFNLRAARAALAAAEGRQP